MFIIFDFNNFIPTRVIYDVEKITEQFCLCSGQECRSTVVKIDTTRFASSCTFRQSSDSIIRFMSKTIR